MHEKFKGVSLAIRQPHNLGNLGEDRLSPVMSALSAADISLRDRAHAPNTHTGAYILMYNVHVHKRTVSKNALTIAKAQHYRVHLSCCLSYKRPGKELLIVLHIIAVSGSIQTHSESPTPPEQLRHPDNCGGSFQCHNKSLVLRSHALTPFYWELVRGLRVLQRGSSSRRSISPQ